MKTILTAVLTLILFCSLAGCAAAPKLGKADTTGFDAANATVFVEYLIQPNEELSAAEISKQHNVRYEEIKQVLQ